MLDDLKEWLAFTLACNPVKTNEALQRACWSIEDEIERRVADALDRDKYET